METIKSKMIIETIGSPKEALTKTLEKVLGILKERTKITKSKIAEPEKAGETVFSSFLEFEAEVEDFEKLIGIILDFGPTNIEILKPDKFEINQTKIQNSLNDLILKINEYSNKIRYFQTTSFLLQEKLKEKEKTSNKKPTSGKKKSK